MRMTAIVLLGILATFYGVAFFWNGTTDTFPIHQASGLLNPDVSGPLLFISVFYLLVLVFTKQNLQKILYIGSGFIMACAMGLLLYVDKSGFVIPQIVAIILSIQGGLLERDNAHRFET